MDVDLYNLRQFEMGVEDESEINASGSGVDIDTVDCIPDILMNSFEAETLPDVNNQSNFFLTQASASIFSDMKKSKFFNCLRSSSCWKLYVSELMFGMLFYEAPWNEAFQSNFLLRKLKDMGKIVVLPKDSPVSIPLSQVTQTVTNCRSLSVTLLGHGLITQMFEFDIKKSDQTTLSCTHMGTSIIEDIITGGSYKVDKPPKGFPKIFKESQTEQVFSDSEGSTTPRTLPLSHASELAKAFSAVLDDIRESMLDDDVHFKIVTSGSDKLVSLWYMKHLSEEFDSKVHVDQHFFNFIQKYLPEFASAFSSFNKDGSCRFHFNCCDSWSNKFDKGCAPSGVNHVLVEVNFICIGLRPNFRIPKSSYCIPYIHEAIYDC